MALRRLALALPLALAALVPVGGAHTALIALPVETHMLSDAADDMSYDVGGWDLWDIYMGEAHVPEVGDGVYFHLILFGDYSKRLPGQNEYKVTFSVTGPGGAITKSISTRDGQKFTTDFDALQTKMVRTDVEVVRGFLGLAKNGLAPGMELGSLRVETFVDGELRDRAPGGYFLPGTAGRVEKPESSAVKKSTFQLTGPAKYLGVVVTALPGKADTYGFAVQNALPDHAQHVTLVPPKSDTWTVTLSGAGSVHLPGKQSSVLEATFQPKPGADGLVQPAAFDVVSDLGGRNGFVAAVVDGKPTILSEGKPAAAGALTALRPAESPAPGLLLVLAAAVGLALLVRRRG